MVTLAGYPPPESLDGALAALTVGRPRSSQVDAAYGLLQQLLPGEKQDATKLEMGRTYEEVDAGEVDRAPGAAPSARMSYEQRSMSWSCSTSAAPCASSEVSTLKPPVLFASLWLTKARSSLSSRNRTWVKTRSKKKTFSRSSRRFSST